MKQFLKRIFIVLASFVVLVAVLEILYRLLAIPKISHQNIYAKAQALMPEINNNTVLIIGDSRLEWGLKPLAIQEKFKALASNSNVVDMAMPGSNGLDVLNYLIAHNIHPKLIIHGFAPNYGGYKNHGFDKEEYSASNKISEGFSYWLDQHFYFRDESVTRWLKRLPAYYKSHEYDALGGVKVTVYGDYAFRSRVQYEMYESFKSSFKQKNLDAYCKSADSAISVLKSKGSIVCGVGMPLSKKIYELQNFANSNVPAIASYNKFYDFSFFTYKNELPAHDSTFFYDGCHLLPEYATVFTGKFVDSLQKDLAGMASIHK